jgi:hypothetical protein
MVRRPLPGRGRRGLGVRDAGRNAASQKLRRSVRGRALRCARHARHRRAPARSRYAAQQTWAMTAGAIALAVSGVVVCQAPHSHSATGRARHVAVARRLAGGRLRPFDPRRRPDMSPIGYALLAQGRPLVRIPYPLRARCAATIFTGSSAAAAGASIGGLFLALPAIFCASAILIEKHEIRRKREVGARRPATRGGGRRAGLRRCRARRHRHAVLRDLLFGNAGKQHPGAPSSARRSPGWSIRWRLGACAARCGWSGGGGGVRTK